MAPKGAGKGFQALKDEPVPEKIVLEDDLEIA
jgi:hypothetical protein